MLLLVAQPLLAVDLPVFSCTNESSLRSVEGRTLSRITLYNSTAQDLTLYWVDYAGARQEYARIPAGTVHERDAYATHVWLLAADGRCVGLVVTAPIAGRAVIAHPVPCGLQTFAPSTLHEGRTDFTRYRAHQRTLRAVMLFVDFPDAIREASDPLSIQYERLASRATRWIRDGSYGTVSLSVDPIPQWYRMGSPSLAYGLADAISEAEMQRYVGEAALRADADVDFRAYDLVYVVASKGSAVPVSPAFSWLRGIGTPVVDGVEIRHGAIFGNDVQRTDEIPAYALVHETLHTLGLPDLYVIGAPVPEAWQPAGGWDIMSRLTPAPHLLAWHKHKLSWIRDDQVVCGTGTMTVRLTSIDTPGGTKAVVIPLSASRAYVAELRTTEAGVLCDYGVLVYHVDTSIPTGAPPGPIVIIDTHHGFDSTQLARCGPKYTAPFRNALAKAARFEDQVAGVTIDVLAMSGTTADVQVSRQAVPRRRAVGR